ncbi:MAG: hypothetical protein HOP23_01720 [Methylococcaceae bacterium]|nr:hypothetical protein [Methylococcaceae bacterium]
MNKPIYIKGSAICCPNPSILDDYALQGMDVDKTLIPATLRRRTSLTTRIAITAADGACRQAQMDVKTLPSVFASLGGEIQVTDALCRLLPKDELLSPTQFHNSVHNTTAGYWGILQQCQAAVTAIAAVDDTFAMGLLEAWTQLQLNATNVLLVCYDEEWPPYLAPPIGQIAFASAFVLSTEKSDSLASISMPETENLAADYHKQWPELVNSAPAAASIPLLAAISQSKGKVRVPLNTKGAIWFTYCETP